MLNARAYIPLVLLLFFFFFDVIIDLNIVCMCVHPSAEGALNSGLETIYQKSIYIFFFFDPPIHAETISRVK